MWYHAQEDKHIGPGQPFTLAGTQYPANWLEHARPEEIEALGLVPVQTVGVRLDDRYHDNAESVSGAVRTITATAKDRATVEAIKWAEIKAIRDRKWLEGGHLVDGHWFHSDPYSLIQQQGLILAARQVEANNGDLDATLIDTPWRTLTGEAIPMTARLALSLLPAAMAQQAAIFTAAETHRAAMEASQDPSVYDCSQGWPTVYGDPVAT